MAYVIDYAPCPRKCVDCEGADHHWIPGFDEEWEAAVMKCKHCPTTRPLGEQENPDEPDFRRRIPLHPIPRPPSEDSAS